MVKKIFAYVACAAALTGIALADSTSGNFTSTGRSDVILAVNAAFAPVNGNVRVTVYDSSANFLESPSAKYQASVNTNGRAFIDLGPIAPGEYAFVAYYDENRDGKLNRGALGIPMEPYAFSNGAKPKFRKPRFEEASVSIGAGSIVKIELDN